MTQEQLLQLLADIDRACVGEDHVSEPVNPQLVLLHVQQALARRDRIIHRFKEWVDTTVTRINNETRIS